MQFPCDLGNKNVVSEENTDGRPEGTSEEGKVSVIRCSTPVFGGSQLASEMDVNDLEAEIK